MEIGKLFLILLVFTGCQLMPWNQKATSSIEETVNAFADHTVLVDTRGAFEYASFHISGSVNLSTTDFLILKNPKSKLRILDPDLVQTIERLARRGISPNKKIILISDKANSDENKKWRWLLKNLQVEDITLVGMEEFRKKYPNRAFAEPARSAVWDLQTSEFLQKEFVLKKAPNCFVKWSDKICGKAF